MLSRKQPWLRAAVVESFIFERARTRKPLLLKRQGVISKARRLLAYGVPNCLPRCTSMLAWRCSAVRKVIYGVLRRPSPAHALQRRVGRHGEVYPDCTAAAPRRSPRRLPKNLQFQQILPQARSCSGEKVGLRCPSSSEAWEYAVPWKAEVRHTGRLGRILCQSCTNVTRVFWRKRCRVQLSGLEGTDEATPNLAELAKPAAQLQEAGFALPTWDELADGGRPPPRLLSAPLENRCEDGSEPRRPAWTPPLARAFFLTLTRLREH